MSARQLPTSVEWPKDWRNIPLWALFDRIKDVGHPEEEMLSVYRAHGVVKKSSRDDNANQTAENRNIYQLVNGGWFIVNRMKAWQGSVGISQLRGIVSGHYLCFRPSHGEDPRFLNWLLRSNVYTIEYARMSRGVRPGQIEIDNDELRGLRVALPPLAEQRRIAEFLDVATSRIDHLTDSISKILELLQAKRRARLLSILPDRRCGNVRLGYYLDLVTSGPRGWGDYTGPTGTPFFRSANLRRDSIEPNLEALARVNIPPEASAESLRSRVRAGDILIGITGANTGWVSLADQRIAHTNVSQHVCLIRPGEAIDGRWLAYALSAPQIQELLLGNQYGGTKTQLSLGDIRDLIVPLPSLSEQQKLVKDVDDAVAVIRAESSLRERQLAVLAERRQALITAAVTGQVDVTTARPQLPTGEGVSV
ncbi:restriction endonuclease subunit S [Streptomyces diastatochromogenes]|uniref:restriction endonuclease subunit S n=1 Tax=Streptomyces diastatochromogenes TaxID=42236 RepID=UPI000B919404|nr:restriction endonuclease subunit S [Streptomyces diastatochromogenes]MCZ0989528.1 restriction endonuclease subunit S [Streptomyces diastatochromogenes]